MESSVQRHIHVQPLCWGEQCARGVWTGDKGGVGRGGGGGGGGGMKDPPALCILPQHDDVPPWKLAVLVEFRIEAGMER